ncbi:hypothetical protein HMPREF9141_1946 [Prevotella multiformis DSM 16608]|uniref:Uncharacterized protein n=1 Tax=Prevotella multiformis DSM 16608 TaxID=888743 RepID=F0F8M9_9BACT|nr:hypothetical protein HMPREF9141_1946 [Prevotella multiformis DSM 16608]
MSCWSLCGDVIAPCPERVFPESTETAISKHGLLGYGCFRIDPSDMVNRMKRQLSCVRLVLIQ